jgi:hypothetical protein
MMSSWNALHNKHKDEVGLVIGNGPSLSDVPLDFLNKYPSFGTNRIYLLDGFTPTYYAAVDPLAIKPFIGDIDLLDCDKFISSRFVRDGPIDDAYPLWSSILPSFSRTPDLWIYEGYTVTYVCLQLAFYMGFTTVLLVGVDHNYTKDGVNHFDKEYINGVVGWEVPDLERSEYAYHMAKTVFEHDGRRIVNLTPGSKLDVFERGEIADYE